MTENGKVEQEVNPPGTTAAAAETDSELHAATLATAVDVPSLEEWEAVVAKAAKADEHWERLLRLTAEMENFKKRAARDRQEAVKFANEGLLEKLLPTLDNFEMAMTASQGAGATVESIRTGVGMILSQLRQVLGEAGLEEINATGQPFNPTWHEAVSQRETAEVPEGHVVQQVRKGYKLRERLLRAAGVIVAQAPAASGAPAGAGETAVPAPEVAEG